MTQQSLQKEREWPGMPVKCMGCGLEYRTNIPCCPECGRGWGNDQEYTPEVANDDTENKVD